MTTSLPQRTTYDGLRIFTSRAQALRHLCDHVLTTPEAEAWRLLLPLDEHGADTPNGRYHLAREAWTAQGSIPALDAIHVAYLAQIDQSRKTSISLNICARTEPTPYRSAAQLTLGLEGMLCVTSSRDPHDPPAVQTAFLAGQGVPFTTRIHDSARPQNPLPRERAAAPPPDLPPRDASDDAYPRRRKPLSAEKERQRRQQRAAHWTLEERIYHDLFKTALRFVSSHAFDASLHMGRDDDDSPEVRPRRDYHLLARPLRNAGLHKSFEAWEAAWSRA